MGYIYRIQDGRADSQIGYYTHWPIPEKYSKEQLVGGVGGGGGEGAHYE